MYLSSDYTILIIFPSFQNYIDGASPPGTFTQFPGYPTSGEDGYLCPNQNWVAWQSFHRHHTGLSGYSPDTAMTNLMSEDEAPPAYSPNFTDWYPATSSTTPSNRDYAEIMTFGRQSGPPPAPPPPLQCRPDITGHFTPSPTTLHTVAHSSPQPITPPAFFTAPPTGPSTSSAAPGTVLHDYSTKLQVQVSSAI